jgi:HSP20 family protein
MEVTKMEHQNQALEAEKQEITTMDETERTRDRQCFIPRADIYETDDYIILLADIPGANENSTDITLEKNILTINANVDWNMPDDYGLNYGEYGIGDYQRSFTLSDEIDRENIEATIANGVLRLQLPKAGPAKTKKISVKSG